MADSFEKLGIVSSYSEASRASRSISGSSFPTDLSLGKRREWSLEDACSEILKLSASCGSVSIASLTTNTYKCTKKDLEFLGSIFGSASCSSPWKKRGVDMFFVIFLFIIVIGLLFFLGPASIKDAPWTWVFILVLFVIALFLLNWWSVKTSNVTCQI